MSSLVRQLAMDEKRAEPKASRPPTPPPSPARSSTPTASFDFHCLKKHAGGGSYNTESSKPIEGSGASSENGGSSKAAKDASISPAPLQKAQDESLKEYSEVMVEEAWEKLKNSIVYYSGKPVGILAAIDSATDALNYIQVFVRDFVPKKTAEKTVDNFTLGEGLLPASMIEWRRAIELAEQRLSKDGWSLYGKTTIYSGSGTSRCLPVFTMAGYGENSESGCTVGENSESGMEDVLTLRGDDTVKSTRKRKREMQLKKDGGDRVVKKNKTAKNNVKVFWIARGQSIIFLETITGVSDMESKDIFTRALYAVFHRANINKEHNIKYYETSADEELREIDFGMDWWILKVRVSCVVFSEGTSQVFYGQSCRAQEGLA